MNYLCCDSPMSVLESQYILENGIGMAWYIIYSLLIIKNVKPFENLILLLAFHEVLGLEYLIRKLEFN